MTEADEQRQPRRSFDDLWDYDQPAETAARFRDYQHEHEAKMSVEERLELLTQIARCHSLQREFDEAHRLLDQVESELTDETPVAHFRCLLERGRTFNSAGDAKKAESTFLQAWDEARNWEVDGYAVDAAHMMGIVHLPTPEKALEWNHRALALAESSDDPAARRWRGSLANNIGWAHFAKEEFEKALDCFERALKYREVEGKPGEIRVARWCIARCLRSLGRIDEALLLQWSLLDETERLEEPDGFVYEEIAECLHALNQEAEAKPYFRMAYELLSEDAFLAESESQRLHRLKNLAGP